MLYSVLSVVILLWDLHSTSAVDMSETNSNDLLRHGSTSPNNKFGAYGVIPKKKIDIWEVLHPPHKTDDTEDLNNVYIDKIPQITIWEFPTERRVFVNDVEIFITRREDDDSSHETIDQHNAHIIHKHKGQFHDITKDVRDHRPIPAFRRPKDKISDRDSDFEETQTTVKGLEIEDTNDVRVAKETEDTSLDRTKREVETDGINNMDGLIFDDTVDPSVRAPRAWDFYTYLRVLLAAISNANKSILKNFILPKINVEDEEINVDNANEDRIELTPQLNLEDHIASIQDEILETRQHEDDTLNRMILSPITGDKLKDFQDNFES